MSSDQILSEAKGVLRNAQLSRHIGSRSAALKQRHWIAKLGRAALGVGAVLIGASIIGGIIGGLGFWGVMATALALSVTAWAFLRYPQMTVPTPEKLVQSDLKTLAGKTEIWLESQRLALPAPAIKLVTDIGVQLDALSPQLARLGEHDPAAQEVRKLVGEHLPELITGYRAIPSNMRSNSDAGRSPEETLISGLSLIEREIAGVTRQIAQGDIDNLSIRGRYLELKYDEAGSAPE